MQINVKTKYFLTYFNKKIKPYINFVRLEKYTNWNASLICSTSLLD